MTASKAFILLCGAAAFAALSPARCWTLDPPIKPPSEALRRLDKEREPAYRAMRLKQRLIQKSLAASKRGDESRVRAIKRQIDKIDKNGWAEDKLTAVLNETRRLYRIEPSPCALYDGKPHEWRTEFSEYLAIGAATIRRSSGKRIEAVTFGDDGRAVFVDPETFESLPRVAHVLIHEAIHFEQFTMGFSTSAVVDAREVEAYAVQLEYGPAVGVFSEEMSDFRDNAENLSAAMAVESDKALWKRIRSSYDRAGSPRRDRLPIRHRNEIIRLLPEAGALEAKDTLRRGPEYWRGYLREKRSWRFLRGTALRLCAAPAGGLKGRWTLKNYAVERRFAASAYAGEIGEYSDCEQDVLADFIVAPEPVRHEDLAGFARAYRMRHGPWKARLAAVGGEFRARLTAAMSNVALAAAARSALPAGAPVRVTVDGAVATVPAGAEYERRDWKGVSSISIRPAPGARIELLSYGWWGNLISGGPADARKFLASLHHSEGLRDFEIVIPATETRFRGRPAWSLTRRFVMGNPSRGVPDKAVQEQYLLVQRRWGFYVLEYAQSPALFNEDQSKFQEFLDRFLPASEPPIGPPATSMIALAAVVGVVFGLVRFRGRKKMYN